MVSYGYSYYRIMKCYASGSIKEIESHSNTRVQARNITRDWHYLNAIQNLVGGVVAHDDGWSGLLDFPADRRAELTRQTSPPLIFDVAHQRFGPFARFRLSDFVRPHFAVRGLDFLVESHALVRVLYTC